MAEIISNHRYYQTKLIVNENSQDITKNTSTLSWQLVTTFNGGSGAWNNDLSTRITVTINGKNVLNNLQTYDFRSSKTKTWGSGKLTIPHNSDGTKSINLSFSINGDNSYFPNTSSSGKMTLTTIPRATKPSLSASNVTLGNSVTINLPRASDKFTHDVMYKFSGDSSFTTLNTNVSTSITWTPNASLASNIPNSTSGNWIIRCITKNGGSTIGTVEVPITLNVPSNILPSVINNLTVLNGLNNKYIQNNSSAKVVVNSTGVYSSSIKSINTIVKFNNTTIESNNNKEFTTGIFSNSGKYEITTTVIDSRARKSLFTRTIDVLAYKNPNLEKIKAYRSSVSGVADSSGSYMNLGAKLIGSDIKGNEINFKVDYREYPNGHFTNVFTANGFNTEKYQTIAADGSKEYEVKFTISDKFNSFVRYFYINTNKKLINFHSSGTGIAINKFASKENAIDLSDDTNFIGGSPTLLTNENLNDVIHSGTYLQRLSQRASKELNYPTLNAGYLEVFASSDKAYILQRYTLYNSYGVWIRHRYTFGASGDGWGSWSPMFYRDSPSYQKTGYHSITVNSKTNKTEFVNFGTNFFNTPRVYVTINSGAPQLYSVGVHGITTTGFNLTIYNGRSAQTAIGVYWVAIGD
ncbi:DUF859 family phage minor structural protein [Helcococcus bovis]|uniref:DUF859 family phage minor structural protein n=1 Tax=Helcococcus bovis TaxID=3153252 RepID=UPI0038BB702F